MEIKKTSMFESLLPVRIVLRSATNLSLDARFSNVEKSKEQNAIVERQRDNRFELQMANRFNDDSRVPRQLEPRTSPVPAPRRTNVKQRLGRRSVMERIGSRPMNTLSTGMLRYPERKGSVRNTFGTPRIRQRSAPSNIRKERKRSNQPSRKGSQTRSSRPGREVLDHELEEYMKKSTSKSNLDKQLDAYMSRRSK